MKRVATVLVLLGVLIPITLGTFVYLWLKQSLPEHTPNLKVPTMELGVTILEDSLGMPTVQGNSITDIVRAQGWLLARDRFFQMDLMRRQMAGKLSEVFGVKAIERDEWHRRLGFSHVAEKAAALMTGENKALWLAYAEGVNAYVSKHNLPWEVQLLRYTPEPWEVKDSLLVVLSMFETLNDPSNEMELAYEVLSRHYAKSVVDFLTLDFGFLDTPLIKSRKGDSVHCPDPGLIDLQKSAANPSFFEPSDTSLGSNAWAVAGSRTRSGKPLLAGDPHLALNVPNLWYRMRLEGNGLFTTGASLPGVPGIVIGTNKHLAWSFTNSKSDVHDDVEIFPSADQSHYRYLGKDWAFILRPEKIQVRRQSPRILMVRETEVGPVVRTEGQSWRALQWTALDPVPLSELNPIGYDRAKSLPEILEYFSHWGGPVQNAIIASQDNHIAWALIGKIPNRVGFDGKQMQPRDSAHLWKGYIPAEQMPRVIDPPQGYVVSANQRMVDENMGNERFGHNWPSAARAYRIDKLLNEATGLDAPAMRNIQLDTLSATHLWYRDTLLEALKGANSRYPDEEDYLKEIEPLIQSWPGTADKNSAAYVFLKEFRFKVVANSIMGLIAKIPTQSRAIVSELIGRDSLVKNLWQLKPRHFLQKSYANYEAMWVESALEAAHRLTRSPKELKALRWGDRNKSAIRHPLSSGLPLGLGRLLDYPSREMDGDSLVVRVAKPNNGASLRMVVDLADPTQSIFSQPGGASGHVLSSHYQDLYESWLSGAGVPLEPGRSLSAMHLTP